MLWASYRERARTQKTLPNYRKFKKYDAILIDGPHGYPFPELEYYFLYPHIKTGGILIVDDVHIASIGRFADFLAEDEMFEFVELVSTTAVFRRTPTQLFDPTGDGWWQQDFNRRRITDEHRSLHPYRLQDGRKLKSFASVFGQETNTITAVEGKKKNFIARLFG